MKREVHYPVTHTQIKTFTASYGPNRSLSIMGSLDQFLAGYSEDWLRTAFVDSAGTNPFHFCHDMTHLVLYVSVVQQPFDPLTMD
jgi:hypothetical protein